MFVIVCSFAALSAALFRRFPRLDSLRGPELRGPEPAGLPVCSVLAASDTMPGVEIPEVAPIRFDADDVKGFKAHLTEHGCAFAPARRRGIASALPCVPGTCR